MYQIWNPLFSWKHQSQSGRRSIVIACLEEEKEKEEDDDNDIKNHRHFWRTERGGGNQDRTSTKTFDCRHQKTHYLKQTMWRGDAQVFVSNL